MTVSVILLFLTVSWVCSAVCEVVISWSYSFNSSMDLRKRALGLLQAGMTQTYVASELGCLKIYLTNSIVISTLNGWVGGYWWVGGG